MTRLATVINKIIDLINTKQASLVAGENIKKLNGESLLGSGDSTTIGTGTLTTTSQNVIGAINEHESSKATKAELTTAQATLNGRIDNIIAGGTAPSEAEIVDARQGADGINYTSLGGAIRGQVSDLKSDLSKVADITVCNNLVNPNEAISGFLESDGTIVESQTWRVSGFIPVDVGKYSSQYCSYIGAYDSSKNFIARYSGNGSSAKTFNFVQSDGIAYIRMTYNTDPINWRCNKGDTIINENWFEDYVRLESDVEIPHQIDTSLSVSGKAADAKTVGDIFKTVNLTTSPFKRYNRLSTFKCSFDGWYEGLSNSYEGDWTSQGVVTGDGLGGFTTYAHVISKFDELVSSSGGYITKNTLGTASGADAEHNTYTLYEYVLSPKKYPDAPDSPYNLTRPKILIDCCLHGFEKNAVYGAYYFIKDIVENWEQNPILAEIRNNVEIKIIPIVNAYGFDNDIYVNANGVNLNRNFDVPGWIYEATGSNSTGEAPFDQPETQLIRDWVSANTDALLLIDCHTNGHFSASGYNNMNPLMAFKNTGDWYWNKLFNAFTREVEKQTAMFPDMYNNISPDDGNTATSFCGRLQSGTITTPSYGYIDLWAHTTPKIIAFTFETCNGLYVGPDEIIPYMSPTAKKIGSEMLGNCIAQILKEYSY